MIRSELYKFFKSWKSKIVIFIALVLGVLHSIDSIFFTGTSDVKLNPYHPAFASFMSGISAKGYYRTYFMWTMPVLFMIAYCGKYVVEHKHNVAMVSYMKKNKKTYFFSKIITSAIVAVIINIVPNIVSIVMTVTFLHGKKGFMDSEQFSVAELGKFSYWCVHNPDLTYIIFLLTNLLVAALLGIMCQSIIFLLMDTKLSMLIVSAIWIGIYFGNGYFFIGNVMQPFVDENTLQTFLMCFVTYIPMVLIWSVAAYFKVVGKNDEI